jgi:phenylalanyl-tRNA synthetase beta chain
VLRPSQRRERRIREVLTGIGMSEVIHYAFVPGAEVLPQPAVRLANPLTNEQDALRTSLVVPGLASALRTNARLGRRDLAIFELGRVFLPGEGRPREARRLGLLLSGQWHPRHWSLKPRPFDLFDVKGIVELLFERLGEEPPLVGPDAQPPGFLHPNRSGRLTRDGRGVGFLGVLHPEVAERLELKSEAVVLELDLEGLLDAPAGIARFRSLDRFPAVERDISIFCAETAPAAEIDARVRAAAGERLRSVSLVDRYTGNQVPPGKVSLTVSLRFQDRERTLTSEEVQAAVDAVVRELRAAGHEIRGE